MAASTITRATWSNDSGGGLDGTILSNARLQNDIYAKLDELFAGAGAYATFTFGGLIAAEGVGTHSISGGGTGANIWSVRNTTAGTGNSAAVQVGNNAAAGVGKLSALSSTYTSATIYTADGVTLEATRAGGLALAATHASGVIQFFSGGTTERARFLTGGHFRVTEIATDPTTAELSSLAAVVMYMKNDKLTFAYNNAGVITYVKLALDGATTGFVHNTTAP